MGNKDKKPDSLKQIFDKTAFGIAKKTICDLWATNRKLIYIDIGVTGIGSSTISGYLYLLTAGHEYSPSIFRAFGLGLIKVPWLTIILFVIFNKITYKYLSSLRKYTVNDTDRNYAASTEGYKGTDHRMTEEEKAEILTCGNYLTQKGFILGCEPGDINKLYALDTTYGKNNNVCITGAPGCGKTRGLIVQLIFQKIRCGESMLITDPKLEIYRYCAAVAKAHGYVVKLLDFRPSHSLHTDTCNYMSVLGNSHFKAQSFSKTVVDNTSDGKVADFWTDSEFNLFIGVVIFINTNQLGISKTLGGVYQFLYSNTVDEFEDMCVVLPDDHPAMPYLKTFLNGDKTVKGNTYAGLQIRLSTLADSLVQRIVGTDDIDFTLPGKQKCIYFISSPDTDKSRSFLVALFFALIFNELTDFADDQDDGFLPIRVTAVLDEFKNIGRIPSFTEKLSTLRSRHIDIMLAIQGIEQIQQMYPDNEWETIMNDCDTHIFMKTNNNINSEYFSKASGTQTTEDKSIRYDENAGDLLKIHPTYTVTQQHGEREVYTPGEIRHLNPKNLLVFIAQSYVVELEKVDFSNHPMCKEMRKWVGHYHAPKWILEMDEKDRQKFHVYDEIYKKESIEDIELCTDEDFLEPWNPKKEAALQEYIKNYKSGNIKKKKARENSVDKHHPKKTDTNCITPNTESGSSEQQLKDTIKCFDQTTNSKLDNSIPEKKKLSVSIKEDIAKKDRAPKQETESMSNNNHHSTRDNTMISPEIESGDDKKNQTSSPETPVVTTFVSAREDAREEKDWNFSEGDQGKRWIKWDGANDTNETIHSLSEKAQLSSTNTDSMTNTNEINNDNSSDQANEDEFDPVAGFSMQISDIEFPSELVTDLNVLDEPDILDNYEIPDFSER